RRQLQVGAQFGHGLVVEEAGRVGGNLKQDTAGRAEINRAEILPVLHRGNLKTGLAQFVKVGQLLAVIHGAEGDVVNGACAKLGGRLAGPVQNIDVQANVFPTGLVAIAAAFLVDEGVAQLLDQQVGGRFYLVQPESDAVET